MILCFDIGGSAIKIAEAHALTDIRPTGRVPTPGQDWDAFLGALRTAIAGASVRPTRLAFSIAGAIDPDTGRANVANIPCLTGRPLRHDLEAALGLPVDLANDADCFALAEAVLGVGRGHAVVLGLILGTGVGGGVVVNGALINPGGGIAGELGHGPIVQRRIEAPPLTLPAFPCGCGQIGCLDAVCSARGMEKLHRHLHETEADSRAIVAGWEAGEEAATQTITLWLELLAGPLAMVQNLLGTGVIAVGGGLSTSAPLIAALDRAVQARILRPLGRPLLVPVQGGLEPGLVGAAIIGLGHGAEGKA